MDGVQIILVLNFILIFILILKNFFLKIGETGQTIINNGFDEVNMICFKINSDISQVCSGSGKCYEPDTCKCNQNNIIGKKCELSIEGIILIVTLPCIVVIVTGTIVTMLCCIPIFITCYYAIKYKKKKKTELEEILLGDRSTKNENEINFNYFQISENDFKIPFSKIKIIKEIG